MSPRKLLPQSFYARDALVVAKDLIGKILVHGDVLLRISEVEAYCHKNDTANHCRFGKTKRNAPMWEQAGHAYVYLCYGIHNMLNVVTNDVDEGAAVLIRSCEPIAGHSIIAKRRNNIAGPPMLTGPGKIGQALNLDTSFSRHPLYQEDGLMIIEGEATKKIIKGPRVGIGYASIKDQQAKWRFADASSEWVSHKNKF